MGGVLHLLLLYALTAWAGITLYSPFVAVLIPQWGHAVAQLAESLPYKPAGRGFDSRWSN